MNSDNLDTSNKIDTKTNLIYLETYLGTMDFRDTYNNDPAFRMWVDNMYQKVINHGEKG